MELDGGIVELGTRLHESDGRRHISRLPCPEKRETRGMEESRQAAGIEVGGPDVDETDHMGAGMFLQVGADTLVVVYDANTMPRQDHPRPDARQHQELRRVDGARAQDDLAPRPCDLHLARAR